MTTYIISNPKYIYEPETEHNMSPLNGNIIFKSYRNQYHNNDWYHTSFIEDNVTFRSYFGPNYPSVLHHKVVTSHRLITAMTHLRLLRLHNVILKGRAAN